MARTHARCPYDGNAVRDCIGESLLHGRMNRTVAGARHNDAEAQMRAMARPMSDQEIEEVATFYARKAAAGGAPGH